MLVKYVKEGSSLSGVNVFRWLAVARPSCVGVEIGLPPFEGKVGFRILRKSGGKNRRDTGGDWWIASTLLSVFSICGLVYDLPVIFFLIYLSDCRYLIRIAGGAAEAEGYRRRRRPRRRGRSSEEVMCCDRSHRCDDGTWATDATMEKVSRCCWLETRAALTSAPKSSLYLCDRVLERVGGKYKTRATKS